MKNLLLIFVAILVAGQAFGQPPRTGRKAEKKATDTYVPTGSDVDSIEDKTGAFQPSDGNRILVEERGFSIVPPPGWEVSKEHPQLSLVMQVPYEKGMKYQRTIQVASAEGSKYIDETTAREFEKEITRKFSRASANIEDYRIRNHINVEMADGRPGILFYSEFVLEGFPLMQMHVLVSSDRRNYLMTYTDVAKHFEDDGTTSFLTRAWDSMISVELNGPTPSRFGLPIVLGSIVGALVLLFGIFQMVRNRKAGQDFERYSSGEGLDEIPEVTQEQAFIVPKTAEIDDSSEEGLPDATMAAVPFGDDDGDKNAI